MTAIEINKQIKNIKNQVSFIADSIESFVSHNILEREQREQNIKKLSTALENFVKETLRKEQNLDIVLKVKTLDNFKGELPEYKSPLASGFDVRAQVEEPVTLEPGQRCLIPTGLSFAISEGYELQARPRSGWAIKEGVSLVNSPGTIDADYRGEVKIILINLGQGPVVIEDQDRIAQLVLCPVIQPLFELVTELDETERGSGGFGSTGKQ